MHECWVMTIENPNDVECPWRCGLNRRGNQMHDTDEVARKAEAERDAAIEHARVTDARLRSIVDLYRSDPMAMADALWRMREQIGALRLAAEDAQR